MTRLTHPDRVTRGQLLWLELEEFPERPKVAVQVLDVLRGYRAQVRFLTSDRVWVSVDLNRLYEEVSS
jgi:hypothetical protein